MRKVIIQIGEKRISATFNNSETGKKLYDCLPITGDACIWGAEIYFYCDTKISLSKNSRDTLEVGELGYWPSGPAFCIFFGPTPMSKNDEPRAASNVNVFGQIKDGLDILHQITTGEIIKVYKDDA